MLKFVDKIKNVYVHFCKMKIGDDLFKAHRKKEITENVFGVAMQCSYRIMTMKIKIVI